MTNTDYVAPASTLPALTEQLMPFTVVDFISRYFLVMGLNVMLVLPDWNARATLALQLDHRFHEACSIVRGFI